MDLSGTNLFSLGKICELIQRAPREIHRAAESAGVKPALSMNGVTYFNDRGLKRIMETLVRPGRRTANETTARRVKPRVKRTACVVTETVAGGLFGDGKRAAAKGKAKGTK